MNKFEKLIEYIINDEDQKARELFHTIVVEKSRDIYESIMDEESMEETVSGRDVEDLDSEIRDEEAHMEAEEGEEEFELGGEEPAGEEEFGDEVASDEFDGEEAEEDKIMDIDAKLDELLAKFDEIMGDEGSAEEVPAEEPAFDGGEEEFGSEEPAAFAEAKEGSAKSGKSGKSGSAKSGNPFAKGSAQSGKSGSAASGKSGKSATELMREYVETVGDIYGGAGDAAEGTPVGTGTGSKKAPTNSKSVTGPGADFGGNVIKRTGADNANPDGTSAPSSEKAQEIKSGNINVPGGKAGSSFKTKEAAKTGEGSTTDGSVPVSDKSVVRK